LRRAALAPPALKSFVSEEVLPGPAVQTDDQMIEEIRVRGVSNLHPGRHLPDGSRGRRGCRPPPARPWHRTAAGRRRLDHAAGSWGNTNAPSIMIGEKCAAMILEDAIAA
jgi:choline dehydrogenase